MGAAEARRFVAEGARVVVGDVDDEAGAELAASLGEAATFVPLDVTDEAAWSAAVAGAQAAYGRLDVLVNNAGILSVAPMVLTDAQMFMDVVRINQLGVFLGMRAVVAPMTEAGGGSIINISSVAGLIGAVGHIAYGASKWAVRGMTKTAALELAPLGIRVNSVHPGMVDTAMLDNYRALGAPDQRLAQSVPLKRLARPEDVAELVLYLASDDSRYSTGSEFVVDGGMTAGRSA